MTALLPCGPAIVLIGLLPVVLVGRVDHERAAADEQVERLALDGMRCVLLQLVRAQMGQQVGDAEHGVGRVLAHDDGHGRAVLERDDAMDRQG